MIFSKKYAALAATVAIILSSQAIPAFADEYLGSYEARLSHDDHYASDGYKLDTAAQVVRQDRANMHKFDNSDNEDDDDSWFSSAQSRIKLETMLNKRGAMSGATKTKIKNGTPLVKVDVYRKSVKVTVLSN